MTLSLSMCRTATSVVPAALMVPPTHVPTIITEPAQCDLWEPAAQWLGDFFSFAYNFSTHACLQGLIRSHLLTALVQTFRFTSQQTSHECIRHSHM